MDTKRRRIGVLAMLAVLAALAALPGCIFRVDRDGDRHDEHRGGERHEHER